MTVSRLHRAKGNEADMVYVIGCDNVAKNESDINLRNQLFVSLSRAKGWVGLSGTGNYPMYNEIQQVIESGDTFTFNYKRPKRNFDDATENFDESKSNVELFEINPTVALTRAQKRAKNRHEYRVKKRVLRVE